jgi:hypothetical protein
VGDAKAPAAAQAARPRAPSSWASLVVIESSGGRPLDARGGLGLACLAAVACALLAFCLTAGATVVSSDTFLETGGDAPRRRRAGGAYRARMPARWLPMAGLVIKDLKFVQRDTIILSQIGTTLVLFLVPFVIRAAQGSGSQIDSELAGYLTLAMIALIVYMVTSVISLTSVGIEGRSAWIPLGAPLSRSGFLRAKWLLSFILATALATALTLVAWMVFRWPAGFVAGYLLVAVCLSAALSGLGVGLAGLFPRFVYDNPAHRASAWALLLGFILGTGYLMTCGAAGILAYQAAIQGLVGSRQAVWGATAAFALATAVTGIVPVWLAERRMGDYGWEH